MKQSRIHASQYSVIFKKRQGAFIRAETFIRINTVCVYRDIRNTVKTLNIGTPRLTTVVVLNIKQFDLTMQLCLQKM